MLDIVLYVISAIVLVIGIAHAVDMHRGTKCILRAGKKKGAR